MAQSKQDELYKALQQKGYPDSLCREIAYKQIIQQQECSAICTAYQIRDRKMWWMRCWQF
jgi:hypothetical protein